MKKIFVGIWAVGAIAILVLTGCAGMNDVRQGLDSGQGAVVQVVNCDIAQAHDAAKKVMQRYFDVIQDDGNRLYGNTVDTVFGVEFSPVGADSTRVSVVSRRTLATHVWTTLSADGFYEQFNQYCGGQK